MAISKERKEDLVAQYTELLASNSGIVLTSFSGITVKELEGLRRRIREVGGEFHIVKNSLVNLAFQSANLPLPERAMDGTTAIGFTNEDVPALAKAIVDLIKESEAIQLKGGLIEGALVNSAQVEQLADLPSLAVLQARLLGLIQAPARQVAGVIAGSIRQLINVTAAYSELEPGSA